MVDPVYGDVDLIEVVPGVDEGIQDRRLAIGLEENRAHLADAGKVGVRGLEVERQELHSGPASEVC